MWNSRWQPPLALPILPIWHRPTLIFHCYHAGTAQRSSAPSSHGLALLWFTLGWRPYHQWRHRFGPEAWKLAVGLCVPAPRPCQRAHNGSRRMVKAGLSGQQGAESIWLCFGWKWRQPPSPSANRSGVLCQGDWPQVELPWPWSYKGRQKIGCQFLNGLTRQLRLSTDAAVTKWHPLEVQGYSWKVSWFSQLFQLLIHST